ncbi:hypothetical protein Clacol_001093 [Clathrus columnatus]|uniref:Ubiquitin 3 binding protein But2 C-terminal domain-containing protein n=1 Tax=Clathrus columnatus TaxID=1419009 RepID=A0AAV5A0G0_9AGAM|nr:hypothetical protein Clacol_001093 [Clathrus columnatus]
MKPFSNVDYAPLLTSEEDGKAEDVDLNQAVPQKPTSSSNLQIWILIGSLACTLTSVLLAGFALPVSKQSLSTPPPPPSGDANLPRPNQYMGLNFIDYTRFKFDPIVNFPPILTQVDSKRPDFVYPDDSRRWLSWIGNVCPDDRHFFINSTVNSIAQFRALDYKMESCQVAINIPSPEEMLNVPPPPSGAPGNKSDFTINPTTTEGVKVQVWKLSTQNDLRVTDLSWKTRPPREKLLETLTVSHDRLAISSPFHCPQDSLQTFEFSCEPSSGDGCLIDFWQDKKEPMLAMYILQSSTHS